MENFGMCPMQIVQFLVGERKSRYSYHAQTKYFKNQIDYTNRECLYTVIELAFMYIPVSR
jgi:hypothetical protein